MPVNRFYNPKQQQYVSQFVPKNLGIMQRALNLQQEKYDESQAGLDAYEDDLLKRQAFGKSDTEYLKGKRAEFDEKILEFSGQDLGNSKVSRDVSTFIKGFKNDEGLSKVQASYDHNVKAQKAIDKLKADGKYNQANVADYLNSARQYSETGYLGEGLADNSFFEDVDVRKGAESLVNNLKASGYTYDKENGTWIDRKSNKSVSRDRIMQVMSSGAGDFLKTQAGQQLVRNSRFAGESINDAYKRLAGSIADEYAYSVSSNTFKDNTARQDRLANRENAKQNLTMLSEVYGKPSTVGQGLGIKDGGSVMKDIMTGLFPGVSPLIEASAEQIKSGVTKEGVLKSIEGDETVDSINKAALGFAYDAMNMMSKISTTGDMVNLNDPNASIEEKALINKVKQANPDASNEDLVKLIQDKTESFMENGYFQGYTTYNNTAAGQKQKMVDSKLYFGSTSGNLGIAKDLEFIDPHNPDAPAIKSDDMWSDGDPKTGEMVGKASIDNPLGLGLKQVQIKGRTYLMKTEPTKIESDAWGLAQASNNISGIGNEIPLGGKYKAKSQHVGTDENGEALYRIVVIANDSDFDLNDKGNLTRDSNSTGDKLEYTVPLSKLPAVVNGLNNQF